MLVRIRSRDGNFRFELQPTDNISVLANKILETSTSIDPSTLALSNTPRGGENLVSAISGDLQTLGISHGDLLFVSYTPLATPPEPSPPSDPVPTASTSSTLSGKIVPSERAPVAVPTIGSSRNAGKKPWEDAVEDAVDSYWEKKDGKINRPKGNELCKCGSKSMCDYCMPLEPYDASYQTSHSIKHLSYHAYLRKVNSSAPPSAQSTSYIPPLTNPSYQVQVPCSSGTHASWPAGICSKCQPSAVTLSRQTFRLVDHVEFAVPSLIDGLLNFWRQTGTQRFGFLLGRYEPYEEVPMGIKAVVEAIHEPPQEPHADGVTVGFPWEEKAKVERLAEACGLKLVGMIYTDLTADTSTPEATSAGKVVAKRHANSFFLSSLEIIFSATLQHTHPNPSRFSDSGKYSSKFVTCVLSGTVEGGIAVEAYQVSDQAMAMVEADMVEASVDPGVMRVKDEGPTRYIPDVFFRYKNKYGLEVTESAKPCFPVEYLLVNVTHGFPKAPNPLFTTSTPFATENRPGLSDQSMSGVAAQYARIARTLPDSFAEKGKGKEEDVKKVTSWLSDWHLLAFLESVGIFDPKDVKLMASVATTKDGTELSELFQTPSWQTFLTIVQDEAPAATSNESVPDKFDDGFEIPEDIDVPPDAFASGSASNTGGGGGGDVDMDGSGAGGAGGALVCPHCTFENGPGATDCDICGLPLAG